MAFDELLTQVCRLLLHILCFDFIRWAVHKKSCRSVALKLKIAVVCVFLMCRRGYSELGETDAVDGQSVTV